MDPSLIRIIGTTGKEGKGENQFAQPRGICIDPITKEIFVVDCNNHRIQVYHLNSLAYIRQIGKGVQGDTPGSLNYAVGICLDDANQIYVADTNNHRVVVFNRVTGGHVRNIGSQGTAPGFLFSPYGVCVDIYDSILYVADYDNHRVQAFNKNSGEFIRVIGLGYGSGDGQMNQPIVICIDYEFDHLLVADYSNNRIVVFDKESGTFLRNIGTDAGPNNLAGPRGLCISKEANILFVADRENHRIQLYDKATYAYLRSVGNGMGVSPGQFQRPMEICVNVEEGVLLVVDGYNHRVQILEIPELQVEKRRLKAAAQSKAEAELRGKTTPKPSLLAVTTQLTGNERVYVDPHTQALRISFEGLGSLYEMSLPHHDVPLLLAHLSAHNTREGVYSHSNTEENHSTPTPTELAAQPGDALVQRQAELFLSVLESLCPEPDDARATEKGLSSGSASPTYLMVTPALFALHSLLERGWTPHSLSARVIVLLTGFLANISSGIVGEGERSKVLDAIVTLLRAAIGASPDALGSVLDAVLAGLSAPMRYQLEPAVPLNGAKPTHNKGASLDGETNHLSVLMAYFELLSHILVHTDKSRPVPIFEASPAKRSTSRGLLSPSSSQINFGNAFGPQSPSASTTHERRRQGAQQRAEILQFVFGANFMRTLSELQINKSKPLSTETSRSLSTPAPMIALGPVNHLGNLLTAGDGLQAQAQEQEQHPAFAADPRVPSRTTPSKSPASSAQSTKEAVVPEICVPGDLCSIIGTVLALRQRRKAKHSISLNEFCKQQREKGPPVVLSADITTANAQNALYHRDSLAALQLKLFQSAAKYLQTLRTDEVHQTGSSEGLHSSPQARRSRGGRNIWRPSEPLAVGDLIDAQDKEKCWFESIVQEILEDGAVKVHFMGWGSKWDDLLSSTEVANRLAPLNTKTKNWRADLFKGGLIEIKCNDDPINQKWMWGKITALDVEEAWVEVSYLFSNEPTVVKRAWLFGETICPVGMHTKDKSKAAAALLVKPLKKVEDIIKEKSGEGQLGDEFMFFDRSDDFEDLDLDVDSPFESSRNVTGRDSTGILSPSGIASGPASSAPSTGISAVPTEERSERASSGAGNVARESVKINGSGASTPFLHLRSSSVGAATDIAHLIKTSPADALQHVSVVGLSIMEYLMGELLNVTLDAEAVRGSLSTMVSDSEDPLTPHTLHATASHQFLVDTALNLVALIAATPFRRLLVPYFTRVAIFHSGMRARLVSGGLLTAKVTSILHSGLRDFDPIIHALDHFKELSGRYCRVIEKALGASISATALHEVTSRIVATVDRCGVTQIANDLIEFILKQENLRYELFAHFVGSERFGESSTKLRKILSYLFKTASRAESAKFQALFEGTLMERELSRLEFIPQYIPCNRVSTHWAMALVGSLVSIYESAQSVSRLELLHIPQCHLAAERALLREFGAMSNEHVAGVALALATALNCLLDPNHQREEVPGMKIAALTSILALQKIIMNEELLHTFGPAFEAHLARRLLSGSFSSLAAERSVLDALPLMPRASKMLGDVAHTSALSPDFSKYLMAGIDNDEIEYSPVLGMVLQKRQIAIQVLCHSTWGRHARSDLYANLRLPEPMLTIQTHFDEFYKTTARQTKGTCSRRLTWCHCAGQVVLTFHQPSGEQVDLLVNEAQTAVLWAFNQGRKTKSVREISELVNLSLEEVRGVLTSLSHHSLPLPLLTTTNVDEIDLNSIFSLSDALINGDFSDDCGGRFDRKIVEFDYCTSASQHLCAADVAAVSDWRSERIDACVVRVLKLFARRMAGRSGVLSATELLEAVSKELLERGQRKNTVFSETEILRRADHLAGLGYIDKVSLSAPRTGADSGDGVSNNMGVAVGYSYLSSDPEHPSEASSSHSITALSSGEALFMTLVDMVDAASPSLPEQRMSPADEQSDSGEGEGKGDCDESKRADFGAQVPPSPVVSETPGEILNPADRVLTTEQLLRGIVHWTSSVRPFRSVPAVTERVDLSATLAESDRKVTITSGSKSTTPPRSDRRLSSRFGSAAGSPLRFGDSPKTMSGGSESKSTDARSPFQLKASVSNSPSGSKIHLPSPARNGMPRPPPPPLTESSQLRFADFAETPAPHLKTFATFATAQLKVINERVHATLGETVAQVNTLLYQHHLNQLDPTTRREIEHFPPPTIEPFLTNLNKAYSVDARDLNDWPELHRELFFALPMELIITVCRRFNALLADSVEALLDAESAKGLWIKRFPLLVTQPEPVESHVGSEDSKQSAGVDQGAEVPISSTVVPKLSLYEYVFSTFACSHPRSLNSISNDHHEDFKGSHAELHDEFSASVRSTPVRGPHSEVGPSPGSSGGKSDKRRARYRVVRPTSASPNQSRSARSSTMSMRSDQKSSPFGISFGVETEGINPEYNQILGSLENRYRAEGLPELVLAPEFRSEDLSNASSRSSSRSNSNGDFTVAQLMQSIETELRGDSSRASPVLTNTTPALSFGESFVADQKEEPSARKSTTRSLLAPLPAGFLFRPEQKMFMPPGYYTSDTMEPFESTGSKSYNISLPLGRTLVDNSPASHQRTASTVETTSESLQDLLRAYFRAFQKHLQATFREAWPERAPAQDVPLNASTMVTIVELLLSSTAQRVSEVTHHADNTIHGLWFVREHDNSLNNIFDAAMLVLGARDRQLRFNELSSNDENASRNASLIQTYTSIEESVYSASEVNGIASEGEQSVRHQNFDDFVSTIASALNVPVAMVLPQLARHHWDASHLFDYLFDANQINLVPKGSNDANNRSFVRLSESYADMFVREVNPADGTHATVECVQCSAHSKCSELFALQCRHFACGSCWSAHIEKSVHEGAGHITCVACVAPTHNKLNAVEENLCAARAGLDLVVVVCNSAVATALVTNKKRIFAKDYALCNENIPSEKELQLQSILLLAQSECISPTKASQTSRDTQRKLSASVAGASSRAPIALPVYSTAQVGSPSRTLLPPSRVRSPAAALVRSAGGTPNRSLSPRADRESTLPRIFSGLSPLNVARISTASSGIGIDASAGAWASDSSEGQTSKYLIETKLFMRTRAAELEAQLKRNQSEAKFEFFSHQLQVLTQYLRAVTLVEYVEGLRIPAERGTAKIWQYCIHEALESLRDLLIVTNIKIRSKWMTAEGLTESVTREVVACLRARMLRLVSHLQSQAVQKKLPRFGEEVTGDTARRAIPSSLVLSTLTTSPVCDLLSPRSEPWVEFGNKVGCKVLINGVSGLSLPEKSPHLDKFSECRQLIEVLGGHQSMSQSVLLSHLKAVEGLLTAGFQTVLFANNICPVLVGVCKYHVESLSVRHVALSLMEKLSHQNSACAAALVELGAWSCWSALLSKRRADSEVCITCCELMSNLFSTPDEARRTSLELFELNQGFPLLVAVLHAYQLDVQVCRSVHFAILQAAEKTFTVESTFVTSGLCEVLLSNLMQFWSYPGVRLQYVTFLERLSAGNKYMQERLVGLEVFEHLINIINDQAAFDAPLLKQTCVAVNALTSTYHAGQTKFATMGGCKAICHALRVCQDLSALTSVLRTVATLALRNSYVQDFFQLESVVDQLLAKREEITALSTRSESFEMKSKANLLLLSLEFALDTVRIPASHHSATHDLTAIAAIAGMRRAGGRLSGASIMSALPAPRGRPGRVSADFSDHEQEESRGDL